MKKMTILPNRIFKKLLSLSGITLFKISFFFIFSTSHAALQIPCRCPALPFDSLVPRRYEIIFTGRVQKTKILNSSLHTAVFEVLELYKGNVTKTWEVHYNPDDDCSIPITPGDEWIMFLNYYQNNNSKLDWCSHSRKHFKSKTDDPFWITSGWEYDDVRQYLKKKLGTYRILQDVKNASGERNIIPGRWEFYLYLMASATGMFFLYYLTKKFLK